MTEALFLATLAGGPEDGARAMARDESLVRHLARTGAPKIVLRSHGWQRPTLSLGRGQPLPEGLVDEAAVLAVEVVRRPTGGGWLLHLPGDLALTTALSGPLRSGDFRRAARMTSQAIALGLAACGRPAIVFTGLSHPASRADVCFQRADRDEVVMGSTKVAGVALARFGQAALVQAALPLATAPPELGAFAERWDAHRAAAAAESVGIDRDALWRGTVDALARIADLRARTWHWPGPALREAEELRIRVYGDPAARGWPEPAVPDRDAGNGR
jgi:lipoate-protein ligase A